MIIIIIIIIIVIIIIVVIIILVIIIKINVLHTSLLRKESCFGKISAQPHTIVKQICFPNGNVLFLSLFSLFKNWMYYVIWGCVEILSLFSAAPVLNIK